MIVFSAATAAVQGTATGATITWVGAPNTPPPGDMLIAVFGFEGVAPGSGPWVTSSLSGGWRRVFSQAPTNVGCGLEVWNTEGWSSGPTTSFTFDMSHSFVAFGAQYRGQLALPVANIRAHLEQAWTGNNPQAPAFYTFVNEMVVAVAAEQLAAPGFGTPTPTGWTNRDDQTRAGFGSVEITLADKLTTVEGDPGVVPWAATAAGTHEGATGVFAIRAAGVNPASTDPFVSMQYPLT